jgi:hypothetical protein
MNTHRETVTQSELSRNQGLILRNVLTSWPDLASTLPTLQLYSRLFPWSREPGAWTWSNSFTLRRVRMNGRLFLLPHTPTLSVNTYIYLIVWTSDLCKTEIQTPDTVTFELKSVLTNVIEFRPWPTHSICLAIKHSLIILRSDVAQLEMLTTSLNKKHTGCGINNSHIWRGHFSGYGGGTVMEGDSMVSYGLAIIR